MAADVGDAWRRTATSRMVRIVWTERAIANLEFIRRYIAQFDAAAAARFTDRLIAATDSLRDYPRREREAGDGCREPSTVRPYSIRHEVADDVLTILRIRHAAQLTDYDAGRG